MKQVGAAVLLPPGAHEDLLWAGNQALWSWAQRHCGKLRSSLLQVLRTCHLLLPRQK